jgi:L-2-hydroxyglutarate oxidase LhgO
MKVETVIVGAGVVGLAVARALAMVGRQVVVLETGRRVGTQTSSRNSGVIHAGIYYPPSSLKSRLCVRGKNLLYDYCARRGVGHRQCGKLIVAAAQGETEILWEYEARARESGAGALERLSSTQVTTLEPQVRCVEALFSPSSGIVDVHELMDAYMSDTRSWGGHIVFESTFDGAEALAGGFDLSIDDGVKTRVRCRELVIAAGLAAPAIAARIDGIDLRRVPASYFARGHYYALPALRPFDRLIYPIAEAHSLGIHATLDLAGRVRFGPDIEWIPTVDYRFGADRRTEFARAIRRYYPALDATRLTPDYTGIRPKIAGPHEPAADFIIDGPSGHGLAGLVNLFGIESPGLTASLAIGEQVVRELSGGRACP